MTSLARVRKERGSVAEYEAQVKEIRTQLGEQFKCLDFQVEIRNQYLQDVGEFFRRKGEIEMEYSRGLERLAERFSSKIRNSKEHQNFRKDQNLQSPVSCWYTILSQTRKESKDHATLGEVYSNNITLRLAHISEDVSRLSKKSKEIGTQMQEELLKVTSELQTAMKTYHQYHTDSISAEAKLKEAEKQLGVTAELALTQCSLDSKPQRRSSIRKAEKVKEKHQKYMENKLKCTRARNDYLLNLAVANAAVSKYFIEDVSNLFKYWDLGFHSSLSRALKTQLLAERQVESSRVDGLKVLEVAMGSLDPQSDQTKIMDINYGAFCLPTNFQFLAHEGDQECEVRAEATMYQEMTTRFQNLESALSTARLETEEISKTLKATLESLQDLMATDDYELPDAFQSSLSTESVKWVVGSEPPSSRANINKRRANQQETETYYFNKVKGYVSGSSRINKLEAKYQLLQPAIANGVVEDDSRFRLQAANSRSQRQRKPRPCSQYHQKLFNGDMEQFILTSGQPIPLVVVSCIRFINLHGLHHEGIFRIPGSQMDVNDIRNAFERGEDPLDSLNEHSVDSVAGVLKLYFRGLSQPIFPKEKFTDFMKCVQTENLLERAYQVKKILGSLPSTIRVVMRYLFAFLNHLSQCSDENMMDCHNLAVCFGPTLMAVPDDQDPVACQAHVNEVIKTILLYHEQIFPGRKELEGPVYEKCMTGEEDYCENEPTVEFDHMEPDPLIEILRAQDEGEVAEFEAVAKYDYAGRSPQELTFQKGAKLLVFTRASEDWWHGQLGTSKGMIPASYIDLTRLSETDPEPRKRSGSSPGPSRTPRTRSPSGSQCPAWLSSPQKSRSHTPQLDTGVSVMERRNTLENVPRAMFLTPGRIAAHRPDRQQSDSALTDINKDMVKNMDSVFRELLKTSKISKGEGVKQPEAGAGAGAGAGVRRGSDTQPGKPGNPIRLGMKAKAAALFKSNPDNTSKGAV